MKIGQSFLLLPYPIQGEWAPPSRFHTDGPPSFLTEDQIVTYQHQDCRHDQPHQPVRNEHCQNHAESHAEYNDPYQSPHLLHNGQSLPCRISRTRSHHSPLSDRAAVGTGTDLLLSYAADGSPIRYSRSNNSSKEMYRLENMMICSPSLFSFVTVL